MSDFTEAFSLAEEAVEAESNGEYLDAARLYETAVQTFMEATKDLHDPKSAALIKQECGNLLAKARELRALSEMDSGEVRPPPVNPDAGEGSIVNMPSGVNPPAAGVPPRPASAPVGTGARSSQQLLDEAFGVAADAKALEETGETKEAIAGYRKCVELFLRACRGIPEGKSKQMILVEADKILKKAEALDESLNGAPKMPNLPAPPTGTFSSPGGSGGGGPSIVMGPLGPRVVGGLPNLPSPPGASSSGPGGRGGGVSKSQAGGGGGGASGGNPGRGVSGLPAPLQDIRPQFEEFFGDHAALEEDLRRGRHLLSCAIIEDRRGNTDDASSLYLDSVEHLLKINKAATVPLLKKVLRSKCADLMARVERLRSGQVSGPTGDVDELIDRNIRKRQTTTTAVTYSRNIFMTLEKVKAIVDSCKENKALYKDPTFPASDSILYMKTKGKTNFSPVIHSWVRPKQYFQAPDLFIRANAMAIQQGSIGNCWMVAAIAAVAMRRELITKLFLPQGLSEHGIYCVKFFIDGEWRWITIDDLLPVGPGKFPDQPSRKDHQYLQFGYSSVDGELWVPLLEKAFAKCYGSYQALGGGETMPGKGTISAMRDMTGGFATAEYLTDDCDYKGVWRKMLARRKDGWLMSCGTKTKEELVGELIDKNVRGRSAGEYISKSGIVMNHAYSILDVKEGLDHRMIRLRNPWGSEEWKGAWSDHSRSWQSEVGRKLKAALNHTASDDGAFWMEYRDFLKFFNVVYMCNVFDGYKRTIIRGQWKDQSAGGHGYYHTWRNNPQYMITIKEPTYLMLTIDQGDPRFTSREMVSIGMTLARTKTPGRRLLEEDKTMVMETTVYGRNDVSIEVPKIEPGTYVLVPSTFKPAKVQSFTMQAFTDKSISVTQITPQTDWKVSQIKGVWKQHTSGGMKSPKNPQYAISAPRNTSAVLVLQQCEDSQFGEGSKKHACCVYVFKHGEGSGCARHHVDETGLVAKSPLMYHFDTKVSFDMEAGAVYTILPCRLKPGREGEGVFKLMLFTGDCEASIKPLPSWKVISSIGRWIPARCGGYGSRTNPHLSFTISKKHTPVVFELIRDHRGQKEEGIAIIVIKASNSTSPRISDSEVVAKSTFLKSWRVLADAVLAPGSYHAVAIRDTEGGDGDFTINMMVSDDNDSSVSVGKWS